MDDETIDAINSLTGAQLGDMSQRDVARTIINITTSLEQVTKVLQADIDRLHTRVDAMEALESLHSNERAAMTRLVILLGNESHTVSGVHELLERQISTDNSERSARQKYLDSILSSLIVLAVANVLLGIYRVLRGNRAPMK